MADAADDRYANDRPANIMRTEKSYLWSSSYLGVFLNVSLDVSRGFAWRVAFWTMRSIGDARIDEFFGRTPPTWRGGKAKDICRATSAKIHDRLIHPERSSVAKFATSGAHSYAGFVRDEWKGTKTRNTRDPSAHRQPHWRELIGARLRREVISVFTRRGKISAARYILRYYRAEKYVIFVIAGQFSERCFPPRFNILARYFLHIFRNRIIIILIITSLKTSRTLSFEVSIFFILKNCNFYWKVKCLNKTWFIEYSKNILNNLMTYNLENLFIYFVL